MLLSHMKNGYWISTFDSALVIFNSLEILSREAAAFAREKQTNTRKILVLKKDGTLLGELARIPSGFTGRFQDPGALELLSQIRLEGLESTEFASATIAADVPFRAVAPKSDGVTIQRRFRRPGPSGSSSHGFFPKGYFAGGRCRDPFFRRPGRPSDPCGVSGEIMVHLMYPETEEKVPCEVFRARLKLPSCPASIQSDSATGAWIFQGTGKGHGQDLSVDRARTHAGSGTSAAAILSDTYR